jgi:hypothetical protein
MSAEEKDKPLDTYVSHDLRFPPKGPDPGVAMSEAQYVRIQRRIRAEVAKGSSTSLWLAVAFAFLSFGASAWIALETLPNGAVSGRVIGNLQAAGIGAGVAAVLCVVAHIRKWWRDREQGHDICMEMDIYSHRQLVVDATATPAVATPKTSWLDVIKKVLGIWLCAAP